jgi:hypothetical protein
MTVLQINPLMNSRLVADGDALIYPVSPDRDRRNITACLTGAPPPPT